MKALKKIFKTNIARAYKFFKSKYDQIQYDEILENGILRIGRHTYGRPTVHVYKGSESRVIIGNFCSISPGVIMITGGIHCIN
jgi:acetyltransferase-like isoleucine patch superfamily enzyme